MLMTSEESPALKIIDALKNKGYDVCIHDPYVQNADYKSFNKALQNAGLLLCLVGHDVFKNMDYQNVLKLMDKPVIFDVTGFFKKQYSQNYQLWKFIRTSAISARKEQIVWGKYILITPGYPSEKNKYNNTFVHSRMKAYLNKGVLVDVFYVNKKLFAKPQNGAKYEFEGVTVEQGNIAELSLKLQKNKYDKILIHFAIKKVVSTVIKIFNNTPLIIWSHGVDIIPWHKRLYNLRVANVIKFAGYAVFNIIQRLYLNKIIKKHGDAITFVFVSEWLYRVAQKSIWRVNKIKNYVIIPNIVDEKSL